MSMETKKASSSLTREQSRAVLGMPERQLTHSLISQEASFCTTVPQAQFRSEPEQKYT